MKLATISNHIVTLSALSTISLTIACGNQNATESDAFGGSEAVATKRRPIPSPLPTPASSTTVTELTKPENAGLPCGSKGAYFALASSINKQIALGNITLAAGWSSSLYNYSDTGCYMNIKLQSSTQSCGDAIFNALPPEMKSYYSAATLGNLVPGIDYAVAGAGTRTQTFTPTAFYDQSIWLNAQQTLILYTNVGLQKVNADGSLSIGVGQIRADLTNSNAEAAHNVFNNSSRKLRMLQCRVSAGNEQSAAHCCA